MDVLIFEKSTRSGAAPLWLSINTPKSRTASKCLTGRARGGSPQKLMHRLRSLGLANSGLRWQVRRREAMETEVWSG